VRTQARNVRSFAAWSPYRSIMTALIPWDRTLWIAIRVTSPRLSSSVIGRQALDRPFDTIELADAVERLFGDRRAVAA
jgi:hypothetical protein